MSSTNKRFLVDAAKYTATKNYYEAARSYGMLLDSEDSNMLNPDHLMLFAKSLFKLGLDKDQMFNEDENNEESGDDKDDEGDDSDIDDRYNSQSHLTAGIEVSSNIQLDTTLYQFDLEEEDIEEQKKDGNNQNDSNKGAEQEKEDNSNISEEYEEQGNQEDASDHFVDLAEGNIFENALYVAEIAQSIFESTHNNHSIGPLLNLMGDIYQELESFEDAVKSYKKAIELQRDNQLAIAESYIKMAHALRWATDKEIPPKRRNLYLKNAKNTILKVLKPVEGENSIDDDIKAHLKDNLIQIKQDINHNNNPNMDGNMSILQAAFRDSMANTTVNDLSTLVKKPKNKKSKHK
ncbi:hypothetical protein TBLA_0E01620 [Henningerozyma blattae CBS 6284]|uniref:Uncharacterized protein n=1 Tax=Henningerozyma blattae (strain ATCC 34711 / CBS 6284 / DSM 70876 / NBRC 10599 / NRRL Y-10934 / UCD 77-7) TaxID=1071380 RepID=I2H4B7_HENB6|nr:hypothetical protein TBLA_0E01620 [Tetrapisispora blattae CBS 6284]CCH61219.1 hypothetical protein TBLA_0E01620 [Tetrapisispora blattae CBS 6284]